MTNGIFDYLKRLFEYDIWANRETISSLKMAANCPNHSLQYMSHIIAAEFLWLRRLGIDVRPLSVWPELSLADCETLCDELSRIWNDYFQTISPAALNKQITYTNSLNQPWTSKVEDVLTHVTMHSTYHRGQIASDLRSNGETPAYTDFIHATRQGFVR